MSVASSSLGGSVRSWRTAFLTLRDESLTSSSSSSIPGLLNSVIFSHSPLLISVASELPPHEVSSDLLFLLELVARTSQSYPDYVVTFTQISKLIKEISRKISLEFSSSSWPVFLDCYGNILHLLLQEDYILGNVAPFRCIWESLNTVRHIIISNHGGKSQPQDFLLVKFFLGVITDIHSALVFFLNSSVRGNYVVEIGKRVSECSTLWEAQTDAFTMVSEIILRVGSSFPADLWRSVIEVVRKVMDILASKSLIVEDNVMPRFYVSLLHCLHLVLAEVKYSLSDHVSAFTATLRMFLTYGLSCKIQTTSREPKLSLSTPKPSFEVPKTISHSPYRPPHLRKRENSNMKMGNDRNGRTPTDQGSSTVDFTSSDSDYSDNEMHDKDGDSAQSAKVRVAAIVCLQDLCQADPRTFTTQWTMLLPTRDVLLPRKVEATLMTCLLFDTSFKVKIASASTLAVMLDGVTSVLQIAEYKEPSKCASFTALSISLGQILMQLHLGILHSIKCETHGRFLTSLFKILVLLISSTPYSRMPGDLLPTVVKTLQARLVEGFPWKSDQTALLAAAISCLTVAFSTSPSSPQVREVLLEEISTGLNVDDRSAVLPTLLHFSEESTNLSICFEALQTLKAVSHNYPNIMHACWTRLSLVVYNCVNGVAPAVSVRQWKAQDGNTAGFTGEKIITAAVKKLPLFCTCRTISTLKILNRILTSYARGNFSEIEFRGLLSYASEVLDECLRAISGFKGTGDLFEDKVVNTPFTSDFVRMKKISSAPLHELENPENTTDEPNACQFGIMEWSETIQKHMPHILYHTSPMVRVASLTCFAGITSPVFTSLNEKKQDYIVLSLVNAAVSDEVPSVRSAACRAIGVISSFPQVSHSAETLEKFIHAVEMNTHDSLVSVRIIASWSVANICESVRYCIDDFSSRQPTGLNATSDSLTVLIECALRLVNDGDKIKANAVRALGNLSRFLKFLNLPLDGNTALYPTTDKKIEGLWSSSSSDTSRGYSSSLHHPSFSNNMLYLPKIVQAFISCVSNGNVKVQWNACHALSNLFLNETLILRDMDWAPSVFRILLLLLRNSTNFKIRIQAAAALAVPASIVDYGNSFSDVVKGLFHVTENLVSDHIVAPSSFKYKVSLDNQVTFTMLHILSLTSAADEKPLKDFLVKKSPFLLEWFKVVCSFLGETTGQAECEKSTENQKREMISKALRSLIEVYWSKNQNAIAQKFENLGNSIR